jgi:phenylalanyl-tRNA synthetase beta chain
MKFSRKWVNEEFVDLSEISDQEFIETMEMFGHKANSQNRLDDPNSQKTHDTVIDFEISPTRPDCHSLIGLSREAAAAFNIPMKCHDPIIEGNSDELIYELLDVEVPAEWLCNRYSMRMVKHVKVTSSPKWLRDRLIASSIKPVNNIIDIINYVRIAYGQPIYAYDYQCISSGQIVVREAEEGEIFTTPDCKQYRLQAGMLVVADDTNLISIAGIIGSAGSGITADTSTIVIEAANYNCTSICQTSRELAIQTATSIQFEQAPDPMLTIPALERACELIEQLQCGEILDGIIDVLNYVPEPVTIEMDVTKINDLLQTNLSAENICAYLKRLDISIDGDTILIPSWRPDLSTIADIATEIGRIHGLVDKKRTVEALL